MRAQYVSLLRVLQISHEDFINFVFFGLNLDPCLVTDRARFQQWLEAKATIGTCPDVLKHKQITHYGFFLCYFMAIYLFFEPSFLVFKYIQSFLNGEHLVQLLYDFNWVLKKFMMYVFHVPYGHPIIRFKSVYLESPLFLKKKSKLKKESLALAVPAPSQRLQSQHKFTSSVSFANFSAEEALHNALQDCSLDVPCGNPFESMVQTLTYKASLKHRFCVVPVNVETTSIVHNVYMKIINSFMLSCVIRVPILNNKIKGIIKRKKTHILFVYCNECKHCLNFGKGKFSKVNFKPTQVFYCRDQKEKQCNICGTTGRINCSFCGSSEIRISQLTDCVANVSLLRAVVANNAAFMLDDVRCVADFLLPCLGNKGRCSNSVLKKLKVGQLLYLTLSVKELQCIKCQST